MQAWESKEEPAEGGGPDAPSGGSTDAPSGSSTVTATARTDHRANLSDAELLKQLSGLAFVQGDLEGLQHDMPWYNLCVYKFTKFCVSRKLRAYALLGGTYFFLVVLAIASGSMTLTPPGTYDWFVTDDYLVQTWDMMSNAIERADKLTTSNSTMRGTSSATWSTYISYRWVGNKKRSIFTPESLQSMCNLEKEFVSIPGCDARMRGRGRGGWREPQRERRRALRVVGDERLDRRG